MHFLKISQYINVRSCNFLAFVWLAGVFLGVYSGADHCALLSDVLLKSCFSSGLWIAPSTIIPITAVWLAIRYRKVGLIYPILFTKAYMDGLLLAAICEAFGSASWLTGSLLMCREWLSAIVLLLFSAGCVQNAQYPINLRYALFTTLIIVANVFDHFLFSGKWIHLIIQ